jgi:hypothetical protein
MLCRAAKPPKPFAVRRICCKLGIIIGHFHANVIGHFMQIFVENVQSLFGGIFNRRSEWNCTPIHLAYRSNVSLNTRTHRWYPAASSRRSTQSGGCATGVESRRSRILCGMTQRTTCHFARCLLNLRSQAPFEVCICFRFKIHAYVERHMFQICADIFARRICQDGSKPRHWRV